jgi:hypothetical protein
MDFEFDSKVPYWRSDVDVAALFKTHASAEPFDDPQDDLGLTWEEVLPAFEMRGHFEQLVSRDACYGWTFTPGVGDERALVMPAMDNGRMTDILAVAADDPLIWGAVTGHGTMMGAVTPAAELRVYRSAWQWLLFGCDGVLPLAKSVFPGLDRASLLIAEDLDHADELAHRIFVVPAYEVLGHGAAKAAEMKGAGRVVVDADRADIDELVFQRAAFCAVTQLKQQGIFRGQFQD